MLGEWLQLNLIEYAEMQKICDRTENRRYENKAVE